MTPSGDNQPLDIFKLKNFVKSTASQLSLPQQTDNAERLFTLSLSLTAAVKKIFFERAEAKFSQEPIIEKREIVQFVNRMRIDALEKFNQRTVFACVHFYQDVHKLEKGISVGVIIVYIENTYVPELLRLLKYPYIDYDDEDEVRDGCGAIANLIAGQFKKEFIALGYADLEMSHFKSYLNNAPDGIEYPLGQTQKYEISFHIEDKKRIVVEMVMAPLNKVI